MPARRQSWLSGGELSCRVGDWWNIRLSHPCLSICTAEVDGVWFNMAGTVLLMKSLPNPLHVSICVGDSETCDDAVSGWILHVYWGLKVT